MTPTAPKPATAFTALALALVACLLAAPAARADAAASPAAVAKGGPATEAVKKANDGLRAALKKMIASKGADWDKARSDARVAVGSLLDFEALAERTMGKHWKDRKPEEKKRYVEAMRSAMEASYLSRMQGKVSVDEVKVDYLGETEKNGHTVVSTKFIAGQDSAAIDYVMDKAAAKKQRAVDVITEGISLSETYKEQIDLVWAKKDFAGVVATFEKKAKKFEAELESKRSGAAGAVAAPVKAAQ